MTKLLRDMFGQLSLWGKFWLYLGLATTVAAAAMSASFGWSVSWIHAVFLAALTIIVAFAPETAYRQTELGKPIAGIIIALICVPLFGIEFYSHAGYTAGLRGLNIEDADVQNMRFDGAQDAAKSERTNLDMWRKQLADLKDQNTWAASVTADALRAQVAVAQKEIDLEASRGGCKSKCALRMKDKADLEGRIAITEHVTDLSKRIEATQRILDGKTTVAATTEHKFSSVSHQNKFLSKAVALFRDGDLTPSARLDEEATQTVNLAMALAGTGLPAFALFLAGLYRRPEELEVHTPRAHPLTPARATGPLIAAPATHTTAQPTTHNHTSHVTVTDERGISEVLRVLREATSGYARA